MKRHGEWVEAQKVTNRVRECMRDNSPLRMNTTDAKMPDAVAVVIETEFDVEYSREEIVAIQTGRGIAEKKR